MDPAGAWGDRHLTMRPGWQNPQPDFGAPLMEEEAHFLADRIHSSWPVSWASFVSSCSSLSAVEEGVHAAHLRNAIMVRSQRKRNTSKRNSTTRPSHYCHSSPCMARRRRGRLHDTKRKPTASEEGVDVHGRVIRPKSSQTSIAHSRQKQNPSSFRRLFVSTPGWLMPIHASRKGLCQQRTAEARESER